MQFDGSGADAATAGPVLADTSKSFTVSAWVKLGDNTASRAALTQGGANNGAFLLEYQHSANVWKFTAPAADAATTTYPGAASTSTPRVGVWTHLVDTYDSAAKTLSLYVNGHPEGVANNVTTWTATGAMRIGDSWSGSVAEVRVWDRVISAAEVTDLVDPTKVGLVGSWDMSDVGPGPTSDASDLAHDLNFYPQPGGPSIPPTGAGHTGTGLSLDGVDDFAMTDTDPTYLQVIHTDQSFTVSAWVRINSGTDLTSDRTAVAQDGTYVSGFFLGYAGGASGSPRWSFRMKQADSDSGAWDEVRSQVNLSTSDEGKWVHLSAVYDAQSGAMRLYVDGGLAGQTVRAAGTAWDATGALTIGRGRWTPVGGTPRNVEAWPGNIDEVRVYQGVADNLIADISGDGRTDLIAMNGSSTWVMLSGGASFGLPTLWSGVTFQGTVANLG